MKNYYPILLSKAGELAALSFLDARTKNNVSPILQILPGTFERILTLADGWNFEGNEMHLDLSLYTGFNRADILDLINNLQSVGINVIPVIQQNSDAGYITLVEDLVNNYEIDRLCVRFSNSSGGFFNINDTINALVENMDIELAQICILVDFGLVTGASFTIASEVAVAVLGSINHFGNYENVIFASGCFPDNLGALNPAGIVHRLDRLEWQLWQILQTQESLAGRIKYSDYGTKHPIFNDNVNFQGSCSIKYTTENEYIIYRGEISKNHRDGNGQYISFSAQLVESAYYTGTDFSFGDERIDFYSRQLVGDPNRKTGNSQSWVEISQNHHITLLSAIL